MELQILLTNDRSKYIQIYEQINRAILHNRLSAHTKLPAKRQLAEQLNVSVMTVQIAYEQLLSEGFIYAIERVGYFVSKIESEGHYIGKTIIIPEKVTVDDEIINFKSGQVDNDTFPYKHWHRLYGKELQIFNGMNAPWQGEAGLRIQIATYLAQARGLHCQPEQVYIFSGFQQQLMNICLFFNRQAVGMEEPGFLRAKAIFNQLTMTSYAIPIDEEGCTVPTENIKVLYTTPAHQYPTGIIMSVSRRVQLLNWAVSNNSYILEDDYEAEFRYKGSPIPTLSHLDNDEHVIYLGTFSKTLLPALRVSYIVIPKSLLNDFEEFNKHQKSTVSKIDQHVIAKFMEEGLYSKHIAKMRTLYRNKRKYLIECLKESFGEDITIHGDAAGLHIIVQLPKRLDETKAITLAKQTGVSIDPVSVMYGKNKPNHHVMIGYGASSIDEIKHGVQLLNIAWKREHNY
ncbi:PLP-dependent aminotransferase family protein [Lysinibacillus sp. LZ02]|uniref:MocR-like pyridoxine biosynthesis transcription factor PdxR n=1 Tax=Lysinibacillus sp. LZ02 TaxID=3420668 RepID=UPI003D364742